MTKFRRLSKEERKKEIRDAARIVFLEHGYRNTTMEDVISRTTLSKGGVYRYYSSTKEILMDMMRYGNVYRFSIFNELLNSMPKNSTFDEIYIAMVLNKLLDNNPDKQIFAMFMSEILYDEDIKELYYEIESKTMSHIKETFPNLLTQDKGHKFEKNYIFFSRIITGIIMSNQMFNQDEVFANNQDKITAIFQSILDS